MNKIVLIVPYFGDWPMWFEAFLMSVSKNPTIHWLCPTDCTIPPSYPQNIKFIPTTLEKLNEQVNQVVEARVPLSPRKFCDLKPAYADIFKEEIKDYEFWGFCDMDIIWGDIREFITDEILTNYDIISSRKEAISGHFTLIRNSPILNVLYKSFPNYRALLELPKFQWMDETIFTQFLKKFNSENDTETIQVYWPRILCNQERGTDSHQDYHLDKWLWKEGKMVKLQRRQHIDEVMYLHFINWKRTFRYCKMAYPGPNQFFISYRGIHTKPHAAFLVWLNSLKNYFFGYYNRLKWLRYKRTWKKRYKSIFSNT